MAKILIVDDEVGIRELLEEILCDEGHTVVTAENARIATLKLREHRPDLVLLDIWLPDQDGIELYAHWCSEYLATMPIIVMSGHATIDHAISATRQGAADFLEKPISLPKLLSVVDNVLSIRQPINRVLQLLDFSSIEPFRVFNRRLSQTSVRYPLIYLDEGDDWIGELSAQSLCKKSDKVIRLDQLSEPLYMSDIRRNSVFFAGDLNYLSKIQQKNFKFTAENLNKKNLHMLFYSSTPIEILVDQGWNEALLKKWMSKKINVPTLAGLTEYLADIARILLSYLASRGEVAEFQLSIKAAKVLTENRFIGNYIDFLKKIRLLASCSVNNPIKESDIREVFQLQERNSSYFKLAFDLPYREAREQFERLYFSYLLKRENGVMSRIAERCGIERTHLYRKLKQIGLFVAPSGENKDES